MQEPGRYEREIDVGQFAGGGGHSRQHLLQALRRDFDADANEAPAKPAGLPVTKKLISHAQLMREIPSFVAPGVRRGRHTGILVLSGAIRAVRDDFRTCRRKISNRTTSRVGCTL
ncbi:hypothetical protein LRC484719_17640 [Mycobacterium riyadhense]